MSRYLFVVAFFCLSSLANAQIDTIYATLKAPSTNVPFVGVDNGVNFSSYSVGVHAGYKFRNKYQASIGVGLPLFSHYDKWTRGRQDIRFTVDFAYLLPVKQNDVDFPVHLVINYYTGKSSLTPDFPAKAFEAYAIAGFQTNKNRRFQFYHQFGLGIAYDFVPSNTIPTIFENDIHFAAMMRFGFRWRFIKY